MKLTQDISVTSHPSRRRPAAALSLDFKRQVYRRSGTPVALGSVLTFARGTAALQVNASGALETVAADVLRREHAFSTGEFQGALFEPEATNLLLYSNDFAQPYWAGYAAKPSFTGGQPAPDGSLTAMKWNCADTTGGAGGKRGGILKPDTAPAGVATASVWLRASAPVTMRFGHSDGTSKTISVTTQWQRFTYTETLPNNQNRIFMLYEDVNADIDVYIWGAQVEYGSAATSNIATNGSTTTRLADQPGLTGLTGVFDLTVTYDDDSTDRFDGEGVNEGWWPLMRRIRIKRILLS
ncbi:hypothetical protein RUESEDTHA_03578 [Ruegeria sp. THAF57]|uniref:phage head spike fiber domain-containing protein n=1 Tax=Ruegeria sp. THAF57 TaxID=2744555 RepID=UPI0015DDC8DC|nr:hypothetical protein [Ruegeria sp. THAF57]CAD0186669.1 hypothetical protein RUESEDTHA_03578 [Ruegeria sp. THAF57]